MYLIKVYTERCQVSDAVTDGAMNVPCRPEHGTPFGGDYHIAINLAGITQGCGKRFLRITGTVRLGGIKPVYTSVQSSSNDFVHFFLWG